MGSSSPSHPETLSWIGDLTGHVQMVEQTLLPTEHVQLEVRTVPAMVDAIRRLAVRGAPAIGVAAGYGVVLGASAAAREGSDVREAASTAIEALWVSRPTAVNLFWALDRMRGMIGFAGTWTDIQSYLPDGWDEDPVKWRSATAATFAASLELVKEGKAELRQSEIFAPIELRRREDRRD